MYIFLAVYQRPLCWWFGIISSACIAWKSFTEYKLVADGVLQLFYIVIGAVGLYHWINGVKGGENKPIITSALPGHLAGTAICLLAGYPLSWLLIQYFGARYGYIDTVLTLLSVWATILLVRKDLHNWVYWIVIDAVYVWLYVKSGGYLFAWLFGIYAAMAVWGWRKWRAEARAEQAG